MTTLAPIKNNIIFKFNDPVNAKGEFEKGTTETGIVLKSNFDDSAKEPRWVTVVAVGPECTIKPGQHALLPNLRWTSGFKHLGERLWKSDQSQVVATRETANGEAVPLTNHVIFRMNKKADLKPASGIIIVVGGSGDTASGVVVSVGPDADAELVGSTIYFDDTNFTDTYTANRVSYSFIKDENILAFSTGE